MLKSVSFSKAWISPFLSPEVKLASPVTEMPRYSYTMWMMLAKKKKKDVQLESCELSFTWGKVRTAAWEAASQIALRDCSKAAVGESQYIKFGEKWKWSRIWLFATPWTVAFQASPSMGFSRQEYWSGLPFPSPGDLPDPGIEPSLPHCRQTL